jgi:hypothetical protein
MTYRKQNIVLFHLFSNGDCLFATTIAKQIKYDNPDCTLEWVISKKCSSIIFNNPNVDIITEIDIPLPSYNEIVFEKELAKVMSRKNDGFYDQVFVSQILGDNFCFYDSIVASSIFRCYGKPITVDTKPVLLNSENEKINAFNFSVKHKLSNYKNVVLFECAPQSNQLNLTRDIIFEYCLQILKEKNTCVILSAPFPYEFNNPNIFDGDILTIRETVALTHFCTLLLGCSSGISWACTSNSAKPIPMVQILNDKAYYFNPLSITFEKQLKSTESLIELTKFDAEKIGLTFKDIFSKGFEVSKLIHNQKIKKQFKLFRGIVANFISNGKFKLLYHFIKINFKENGFNFSMIKYMFLGFLLFPFKK